MPLRFMERMARQAQTLKDVFGDPGNDPPPYPINRSSRSKSEASAASQMSQLTTPPPQYAPAVPPVPTKEQFAIPKDSLVLVTGANSWQGTHPLPCFTIRDNID